MPNQKNGKTGFSRAEVSGRQKQICRKFRGKFLLLEQLLDELKIVNFFEKITNF